jgi:hypothetical protein
VDRRSLLLIRSAHAKCTRLRCTQLYLHDSTAGQIRQGMWITPLHCAMLCQAGLGPRDAPTTGYNRRCHWHTASCHTCCTPHRSTSTPCLLTCLRTLLSRSVLSRARRMCVVCSWADCLMVRAATFCGSVARCTRWTCPTLARHKLLQHSHVPDGLRYKQNCACIPAAAQAQLQQP